MAGDWIKVEHATILDKEEVLIMSERLGITPEATLGHLLRWFVWLDTQSRDGNVRVTRLSAIDGIARLPGFGQALAEVGWLARSDRGIEIPKWDRHNGKSAKKRALTMERVRAHRAQDVTDPKPIGNAPTVTREREESYSPSENKRPRTPPRTPKGPMPEGWVAHADLEIQDYSREKGYPAEHLPLHWEAFLTSVAKSDLRYAGLKGWQAAFKSAVREDWAGLRSHRVQRESKQVDFLNRLLKPEGDGHNVIEGTAERHD